MKLSVLPRPGRFDGPPADPQGAAAYWVARRRLRLMSARDEAAFEAWRAEPAHAAAFAEADAVVEEAGAVAALPEVRRMRETALASASRPPARWRPAAAAAVLAAMLGAGVWISRTPADPGPPPVREAQVSPAKRYATKVGERLNVRLEDGSIVALNTATVLEVAYSSGRRDVRLVRGQALFEVAKNRDRPFVVTAGDRRVTALGTAFDVRLDGGAVKVVLVEGRVVVDPVRREGLERLVPALGRRQLDPGEQFAAVGHTITVAPADTGQATSWRRGQVIFRDDSMAAAVAEMNRYSTGRLVIEGDGIGDLKVSGVFGAARGENFIAAVTAYYPLEAQRRAGGVTALVWRERQESSPAS